MAAPEREHTLVDAPTLAKRLLGQVRHQMPNVAVDAMLMTLATVIVSSFHKDPVSAQRLAAQCGQVLRDAVGREARDALVQAQQP